MARRLGPERLTAEQYLQTYGYKLRRKGGAFDAINISQFRAQQYEKRMVDIIASIAEDITTSPQIRKDAALTVVELARGRIRERFHDGQTIDPQAVLPDGTTVEDGMAKTEHEIDVYQQIDDLVRRRVHPSSWPAEVRAEFSPEDLAAFAERPRITDESEKLN